MSYENLLRWFKCIDLSSIRHLNLGAIEEPRTFDHLVSEGVTFSALETLEIRIIQTSESKLQSLMGHLQPLKDIRLTKGSSSTQLSIPLLKKIVQRHGPTLGRLTLEPLIRTQGLRLLESRCLQLKYLKITVPCSVVFVEPPRSPKLSRFCPNIPYLQELELQVHHPRYWKTQRTLDTTVPSIWDLIKREKQGESLHSIHIHIFNVNQPPSVARFNLICLLTLQITDSLYILWRGNNMRRPRMSNWN